MVFLPHTVYTLCLQKIPNVIGCNLKKNYQILIIFGTSIPDTTGHQMTVRVSTSPSVCFCTTSESSGRFNLTHLSRSDVLS